MPQLIEYRCHSVSANASKTNLRPADRKVYNIVHLIYRSRH